MSGGSIGGQVEGGTGRSRHSCRAACAHTGRGGGDTDRLALVIVRAARALRSATDVRAWP
jgi:hypothetical protein